jgi:hypothetical protein
MPWARDNIFWAVVVLVLPPTAAYLREPNHSIDWLMVRTTLWLYFATFVVYMGYQLVRAILKLDAERIEELQASSERERVLSEQLSDLERKYFDERPQMGLYVMGAEGRKAWRQAVDNLDQPVRFFLQHLGGRAATSIRIDPICSLKGNYSLRFDGAPFVSGGPVRYFLKYEVWQDGGRPNLNTIEGIGWGAMLEFFLGDSPPGLETRSYNLVVRFRDRDEEHVQEFKLVFDATKYCFLNSA